MCKQKPTRGKKYRKKTRRRYLRSRPKPQKLHVSMENKTVDYTSVKRGSGIVFLIGREHFLEPSVLFDAWRSLFCHPVTLELYLFSSELYKAYGVRCEVIHYSK